MKNRRILVVDDDGGHRSMLETVLCDWGYEVSTAANGREALEKNARENPDLVLLDVRMPVMGGAEALRLIHAAKPHLPVILMTAFSEIADAVDAMRAGARDYLAKPLNMDRLKTVLEELLRDSGRNGGSTLLVGQSAPMRELSEMIGTVAPSEATVLITGESGTGKELAAKSIHLASARKAGPFVAVNCGAFTESLLASELFGHEKGAFTGADRQRPGLFAEAAGGTLLLDEIGEMPLPMQVKLLRVLQEREVLSVGAQRPKPLDCRIIAATNRDLAKEAASGSFREDLYYRLNVVNLRMPPLRDRQEDVPELAGMFAQKFSSLNNKPFREISPDAMRALEAYHWPGNVRELENVIERAIVLMGGDVLTARYLPERLLENCPPGKTPPAFPEAPGNFNVSLANPMPTLEEIERAVIMQTLERCGQNKTDAAKSLGISRKTLHAKLNRYRQEDA